MRRFWLFVRRFAQKQLQEVPDTIRCRDFVIRADYQTGAVVVRHLGDPSETWQIVAHL
jgi:hypothetical protein